MATHTSYVRTYICSHVSALYYSVLALRHWDGNRDAKFPPNCPRHALSTGASDVEKKAFPHWFYSYDQLVLKCFDRITVGEKASSADKILWDVERKNYSPRSDALLSMIPGQSLIPIRDKKIADHEQKAATKPIKKRGRPPKIAAEPVPPVVVATDAPTGVGENAGKKSRKRRK